jgi:hypothetical protein
MSDLQKYAISGTRDASRSTFDPEYHSASSPLSVDQLETSRLIMVIKAQGNDAYKRSDFETAYHIYR